MMPRLWDETIATHRREVHGAILDATAALVASHGLHAVTMSQIAENSGIGRATLYKYFPHVEAVLSAWHERQITRHLDQLTEVRNRAESAGERLEAVLEAFAQLNRERARHQHAPHSAELVAFLHQDAQVARAQRELGDLVRNVLVDAAQTGNVRDDVAPDELMRYCLYALSAASSLTSDAAVRRLVAVTLAGLRPLH